MTFPVYLRSGTAYHHDYAQIDTFNCDMISSTTASIVFQRNLAAGSINGRLCRILLGLVDTVDTNYLSTTTGFDIATVD